MTKYMILLMILLNQCGDQPECMGPIGSFSSSPTLSINSCINLDIQPIHELYVDKYSQLRKCGWHDIEEITEHNGYCTQVSTKSLNTLKDYYHGFIVIDITCKIDTDMSTCKTVWELEFHQ